MIRGVIILKDNKLISFVAGCAADRWDVTIFVSTDDNVEAIKKLRVRRVEINFCDVVALGRPINFVVIVGIEFLH